MSGYLQWIILSSLTGSPVGAAAFLFIFWFAVDRFTFGLFPDPVRWFMRRRREARLRRMLQWNENDRRARGELAELLVARGKFEQGLELLRKNLEAGDTDLNTAFSMGLAAYGAGHREQAEKLLAHVQEEDPDFRMHEVDLVLGRYRLKAGDFAGAKKSLEVLLQARKGSVEGRVLLARALEGLKDDGAAALVKDAAWAEYAMAPMFQRRKERFWAWRARPSRPALYALALVCGLALAGRFVFPAVQDWAITARDAMRQQQGGDDAQ
jgi:tetratricopeptide (TPR) repeat protein